MGIRVTAVMIASNGSAWLDETIPAVRAQTRRPDRVIAVDNGSSDDSSRLLQASGAERVVVSQHRIPFGKAVQLALAGTEAAAMTPEPGSPSEADAVDAADAGPEADAQHASGEAAAAAAAAAPTAPNASLGATHADRESDADVEWLWLLAHDTAPEPDALERILATVQRAPSVAVAGPKLLDWFHPERIVEMGQSLTRSGARWQLNRQELDQQQYDDQQDTLGVGPAGMLVRRDVWEQLGGFDPALPVYDDGLDFSV
ncbi:glycosyltransferase family 2 protein, partial [Leucobacter sp. M11]|uniref:glycosyltransferase family 2 protein n=1 Tax=Leucobacter sp. M11 TaxID=2993565 RepID=UPI002D8025B9